MDAAHNDLQSMSPEVQREIRAMIATERELQDVDELIRQKESEGFIIHSMVGNGDCCFELLCRWEGLLQNPACDTSVQVSERAIQQTREKIAKFQLEHGQRHYMLKTYIAMSLKDWYDQPTGNGGRNSLIKAAVDNSGSTLDDWVHTHEALTRYTSAVRNGSRMVYGDLPELEAFALLTGCKLSIHIPGGSVTSLPSSMTDNHGARTLHAVCALKHFHLMVPQSQQVCYILFGI